MATWDELRYRIHNWKQESAPMKSYVRTLSAIIEKAEEWGMDPNLLERASNSNLRDITSASKAAIKADDKAGLEKIFQLAAELSNTELNHRFRSEKWDRIPVKKLVAETKIIYRMEVSEIQLGRIQNAMRRAFVFKMENGG